MLRHSAIAALVSLAMACSAAGPLSAPSPATSPAEATDVSTPRDGHTEATIDVRVKMVITGDSSLGPIEVDAQLRIVEIVAGANPREIWFYSVSPARPIQIGGDRLMLFSADLAPGVYTGPGRYTLSDESGVTVAGKEGLSSGAYVQLYRRGGPDVPRADVIAAFRRYDRFGAPCTLDVTPQSMTGAVSCPSLLDEDGDSVELHWNWARV